MSNILKQLQRDPKFRKQEQPPAPAPADTNGLGDAIAQVIRAQVAEQVEAAVEKQKPLVNPRVPQHLQPFTQEPFRDTFPPPPPQAKPVRGLTVSLQRNEVGRVKSVSIGKTTFTVQRDGEGRLIGMRQED